MDGNAKAEIGLWEIFDMDQLYRLLDNWSQSCGMAAMILDIDGNRLTDDFGITEFCSMIQSTEEGLSRCRNTWQTERDEEYECQYGFNCFSVPIILPDGKVLGRVLAGQALSLNQEIDEIMNRIRGIGIDEDRAGKVLAQVSRKTEKELHGAFELLKETLHFFVENSYHVWNARNELKKGPARKDRVLSQITRIMYSYNLTVDLETDRYTLITGTGMERSVEEFMKHTYHSELKEYRESIVHPAYSGKIRKLLDFEELKKDTSKNGMQGTLEYPVLYPGDDEFEWHEINVFIDTDEDGKRVAYILGRDITEMHNAQEKNANELRAADSKNRILSELTKMLYSYNLTLNLRTGKYSMIIGTGMTRFMEIFRATDDYETAYNQKISYLDPEHISKFAAVASLEALRARSNANGFIGNLEYRAFSGFGEEWHEINVFISTDTAGDPVANILGRDITDTRKRQEQREIQHKASMARDQLLSGITKMLYGYNVTVNLETWKYSLIKGTGMESVVEAMEKEDDYMLLSTKLLRSVSPDFKDELEGLIGVKALKEKMTATGYIGSVSYSAEHNGKIRWAEANLFVGTNEEGVKVANILGRDITEAHEKADTKAQLEIANASSEAKTAFLFNMSHDIRTPMNAIIGFTELLEKHLDNRQLAESYIKKIKISNDFLLSLINNVLEMARIESGKVTLDEMNCNAYEFNDTLYSLFDSQMREKGIHFTRTIDVENPYVILDETKLREIFLNILSNALKYTPAGGRISMDLKELSSSRPGYAVYRTVIEDNGIGMSEEFLPLLFEEFSRERSSTESRLNGTGLGMPIVKKLVELMEGNIEVESEVGKGTRITVTLPHRIAQEEDGAGRGENPREYDAECFEGKRILLAEDNELNAEIAETILTEAGFLVERAEDGIICVDMLKNSEPGYYDLILMDIQMPNMDGYKATKTIRKLSDPRKAEIIIVAMTANAFEEDKRNAYAAGMNRHIAKPIKVDELMCSLAEILKLN